jgi:hypothetical protein
VADMGILSPVSLGDPPPSDDPPFFSYDIPLTINMKVVRPDANFGMFQDATIAYTTVPPELSTLSLGTKAYISTESFRDGITWDWFWYRLYVAGGYVCINRIYATSVYGSPFQDAIRYRWLPGQPGNTLSPFVMLNGHIYSGGDPTSVVSLTSGGGDPPLEYHTLTVNPITAIAGEPTGPVTLGSVSFDAGADEISDIPPPTLQVDWGDDSSGTAVLIQKTLTNWLIVGEHLYQTPGNYSIKFPGWVNSSASSGSNEIYVTQGTSTATVSGSLIVSVRNGNTSNSAKLPIGNALVNLDTGGLSTGHALDFDLSPGTTVGGNPSLVYNSDLRNWAVIS